jgi:superfamily II DNA or RNA helicase
MWNGKKNVPQMITAICSYKPRNDLIIQELKEVMKDPHRRVLILSDRRNHLKELEKRIKEAHIGSIGYYVGGMKEEELKESESKHVILATFAMASEGMDLPHLNTLILASPVSAIEQPIGRIQRQKPHERKCIPYTIDIWDQHSIFRGQGKKRCEFYLKNNYTVQGINGDNISDVAEDDDKKEEETFEFQVDSDEEGAS